MKTNIATAYQPRKTPIQARSAATVEAIVEATIQVLLAVGLDRLTTTRVAERAGVSVGTLYQYYPNKQSLLFALLKNHTDSEGKVIRGGGNSLRRFARQAAPGNVERRGAALRGRQDGAYRYFNGALSNLSGRRWPRNRKTNGPAVVEGAGGRDPDGSRHRAAARQIRDRDDVRDDGRSYTRGAGSRSVP
jgi:AcrR family transcriptional regulator